jgi:hypothetical protein
MQHMTLATWIAVLIGLVVAIALAMFTALKDRNQKRNSADRKRRRWDMAP